MTPALPLWCVFFFSSRRRHTRCGRDWSSDVCSSDLTEAIGIHAIFGAFVLGVIVPHDSRIARQLREQLEGVVVVLLLPAFFAFTGLRTQVGLLRGASGWLLCGGIILVASLGKFGGSAAAARLTGLSWHDAAALGGLMNTRGLVELIVLNKIGR